jgi:hypothetical protein
MEAVQRPQYLPAYETRLHVKDARLGPREITELAQKQPCDSRHAAHIQLRKHCQVPSLAGDRAGHRHENDVNPGSVRCHKEQPWLKATDNTVIREQDGTQHTMRCCGLANRSYDDGHLTVLCAHPITLDTDKGYPPHLMLIPQ